jgi:hypothetical protein
MVDFTVMAVGGGFSMSSELDLLLIAAFGTADDLLSEGLKERSA